MKAKTHRSAFASRPALFLTLMLGLGSMLTACGDESDSRLSDDDVVCLKIIRSGGTCGTNSSGTSTATITATTTTTTTDTSTVTVTSTGT